MIIIYLSLFQKFKLLFGWYVQIELWPRNAQSYSQYVLPPWQKEREWQRAEQRPLHREAAKGESNGLDR